MENVFLRLLNMSITASWITLALLIVRPLFHKISKRLTCMLWGIAGLRLVFPFYFKSVFSLIPSTETIPYNIALSDSPSIHSGIALLNSTINPVISEGLAPDTTASANPLQIILFISSAVWLSGVALMLLYTVSSYFITVKKLKPSIRLRENIFLSDNASSPFIIGIFKPSIYLPSDIGEKEAATVIAHEKAHLKRRDHITKLFSFILLSIYWFNPVMWIAYLAFSKDIELACDESVIKKLSGDERKEYSSVLLSLSSSSQKLSTVPLAFGEVAVKSRIKSVLKYKKPVIWLTVAAITLSAVLAAVFLTDPKNDYVTPENLEEGIYSEFPGVKITVESIDESSVTVIWKNESGADIGIGESFSLYLNENGVLFNCLMTEKTAFNLPLYIIRNGESLKKSYNLTFYNLESAGTYRFQSSLIEMSNTEKSYKIYTEFQLESPYLTTDYEEFVTADCIFNHGGFSFSFVPSGKDGELYRLLNKTILQHYNHESEKWEDIAIRTDDSPKDTFFNSIYNSVWSGSYSPEKLKKENRELLLLQDGSGNLYAFLRQKNGRILFATGYENFGDEKITLIRFIFETQVAEPVDSLSSVYKN